MRVWAHRSPHIQHGHTVTAFRTGAAVTARACREGSGQREPPDPPAGASIHPVVLEPLSPWVRPGRPTQY